MAKRKKYLLDTNVISHAVSADWNRPEDYHHWISRHLRLHQDQCYLPSISVEEIAFGVNLKNVGQEKRAKLERWLNTLPTLPYDQKAARIAGKLEAQLKKQGINIHNAKSDIRIAALALEHNLPLVTHNVKDFQHIPNLQIINWADTPMSGETFIEKYVSQALQQPLEWFATLCMTFHAIVVMAQPTFRQHFNQYWAEFFLNILSLSFLIGMVLALLILLVAKVFAQLKKRHVFQ